MEEDEDLVASIAVVVNQKLRAMVLDRVQVRNVVANLTMTVTISTFKKELLEKLRGQGTQHL